MKTRIWFDMQAWKWAGKLFGYTYVSFWSKGGRDDGDRFHRQIIGPFFLVDAGRCCSTTGSRYDHVDPNFTR